MECAGKEDDGRLRHDVDWERTAVGVLCGRSENEGEEQRARVSSCENWSYIRCRRVGRRVGRVRTARFTNFEMTLGYRIKFCSSFHITFPLKPLSN